MSRKMIRLYYDSDSYDELVMEFLDELARKKGLLRKDLILDILRTYWLPIVLKQSTTDSFELDYSTSLSISNLNSQINLIINQLDLKLTPNTCIERSRNIYSSTNGVMNNVDNSLQITCDEGSRIKVEGVTPEDGYSDEDIAIKRFKSLSI